MMGIVWAIYLLLLLPLYIVKKKQEAKGSVFYKLLLSGTFCVLGLCSLLKRPDDLFTLLFFIGMFFSLAGDYYLVCKNSEKKKMALGILCFAVTQILYITAMILETGFHFYEFITVILVFTIVIWSKFKVGLHVGSAAKLLFCYSLLVTIMGVKGIFMLFLQNPPLQGQWIFSLGTLLFLISDICLAVWRFGTGKRLFSYIVDVCYFTGQLLIATVIFYQ